MGAYYHVTARGNQRQAIFRDDRDRMRAASEDTAGGVELMALTANIARTRNLGVLFTEHDMAVVFAVATRITVLHQGRVLAEGTPAEVRARPEVQQVYLGETA